MRLRSRDFALGLGLSLVAGGVCAIGLGDAQGDAVIGQRLELSIPLLGFDAPVPEVACFRLAQPTDANDDLPWVKNATLFLRGGGQPALVLRTVDVIREPVLRLVVDLNCGHALRREYLLLASPPNNPVGRNREASIVDRAASGAERQSDPPSREAFVSAENKKSPNVPTGRVEKPRSVTAAEKAMKKPSARRSALPSGEALPDRLMLSAGDGNPEPVLQMSSVLGEHLLVDDLAEARRDVLRAEYRVLMSLLDQATTQLAAAEKIRQMEGGLQALQQLVAPPPVTEPVAASVAVTQDASQAPAESAPKTESAPMTMSANAVERSFWLDWGLYLMLILVLLVLSAWLFWRYYRESRDRQQLNDYFAVSPVLQEVPQNTVKNAAKGELEKSDLLLSQNAQRSDASLDLDLGMPATSSPRAVADLDLDLGFSAEPEVPVIPAGLEAAPASGAGVAIPGFAEPNPVMELADIMLSFGRVKGAAQALQEYIDNNPQEALQPWIRLMDVYRLAGMRDEFETVARNLNQHFNVEVQSWDAQRTPQVLDFVLDAGTASVVDDKQDRVQDNNFVEPGLEDMSRIMECIVRLWPDDEYLLEYLNQLLRDNRGGQRQGFALAVVDDILFLIELKETIISLAKDAEAAER